MAFNFNLYVLIFSFFNLTLAGMFVLDLSLKIRQQVIKSVPRVPLQGAPEKAA